MSSESVLGTQGQLQLVHQTASGQQGLAELAYPPARGVLLELPQIHLDLLGQCDVLLVGVCYRQLLEPLHLVHLEHCVQKPLCFAQEKLFEDV